MYKLMLFRNRSLVCNSNNCETDVCLFAVSHRQHGTQCSWLDGFEALDILGIHYRVSAHCQIREPVIQELSKTISHPPGLLGFWRNLQKLNLGVWCSSIKF